jgi:hypothetical protein
LDGAQAQSNLRLIHLRLLDIPMDKLDTVYQVADNAPGSVSQKEQIHHFGVCRLINGHSADIYPVGNASDLYYEYVDQSFSFSQKEAGVFRTDVVLNRVSGPVHGQLEFIYPNSTDFNKYSLRYTPDAEFVGTDTFTFEVEVDGVVVWIYYIMSIGLPGEPSYMPDENGERSPDLTRCPRESWKFTQLPVESTDALTNW